MILQIVYVENSGRQSEQYIDEVDEVRFYDTSLTYKKNKGKVDEGFINEIDYVVENDISAIYMLDNNGKTLKIVRDIQGTIEKIKQTLNNK